MQMAVYTFYHFQYHAIILSNKKKILCDFKNPKHFNFRSFIKIMLKGKNKVYSSRIRTGRSFLLSFLLLFVAMPHNDIHLLIWSHNGKWVLNF